MVMKSLAKKAKAFFRGRRREQPEVTPPPAQNLQAPPEGNPGGGPLALHGWRGASPAAEQRGGPQIGGSRAAFKPGVKPGGEKGPLVIGKREAPKVVWKKGEKGGPKAGALKIGGGRGEDSEVADDLGKGAYAAPLVLGGSMGGDDSDVGSDEVAAGSDVISGEEVENSEVESDEVAANSEVESDEVAANSEVESGELIENSDVGSEIENSEVESEAVAANSEVESGELVENSDVGSEVENSEVESGELIENSDVGSEVENSDDFSDGDEVSNFVSADVVEPAEIVPAALAAKAGYGVNNMPVPAGPDQGIFQHSNPEELGPEFIDDGEGDLAHHLAHAPIVNTYAAALGMNGERQGSAAADQREEEASADRAAQQAALGSIIKAPNVQPITPEHRDAQVARLQKGLRDNSAENKDVDEVIGGRHTAVIRGAMSTTEKRSAGWANLTMRQEYRTRRLQGGHLDKGEDENIMGRGNSTQYFVTRAMRLDEEARTVLAKNLKAGGGQKREDAILQCVDGKFVNAKGELVDSSEVPVLNQALWEMRNKLEHKMGDARLKGLEHKLAKHQEQLRSLLTMQTQQETARKMGIAGRLIFVMNSAGEFFAGRSIPGVIHHSSFLAGGAVSGAGEIAISGGQVTAISNTSGHYRPGPAYLWQAVKQLELLGVDLDNVRVDVMGVSKPFKNAREFLGAFDPSSDPSMFDAGLAVAHLNKYLEEKGKSKKLEDKALERSEEIAHDGEMKPPQGK